MIRNFFEIERNISDSNWHIERNFMIKQRQKPKNLLKFDVSLLVLSITCLIGTFLFYIMRLMEEHEEKVSQMFNQKRVFNKGWDFSKTYSCDMSHVQSGRPKEMKLDGQMKANSRFEIFSFLLIDHFKLTVHFGLFEICRLLLFFQFNQ